MDVIFSLCFLGGCSPEEETVNKLFEYVTMNDRTVEEDGAMTLTPVVRSFVFQVLLQFEYVTLHYVMLIKFGLKSLLLNQNLYLSIE